MPDQGHIETELILRETEADVRRVYQQAVDEIQKKLDDYFRRYQVKDEIKRQQLAQGEITAQEYADWRKGQIMIGQRWEEMRDTLAEDLHNSNAIARSIVQGHIPEAYAVNHNYATFQVEKGSMLDTSYTLYDRQTVERIIRDQPDLLPPPGKRMSERIAANKDIAWQRGKIQSVTMQSILQGESIPKMAKRIAREMGEKNNKAATRYARTAMTGAQNAGRVDAYKRAEDMGIELEQEWLATLDGRTRHSHRQMDGQHVKVGEKFSNGCRFPGDPSGPGWEIWNCRCTLVPRVKGVDQSNALRNSKLGDMTYDEWKAEHESVKGGVVDGTDISDSWVRRPGQFDFEIEDVVNAQGFDGFPRVVDESEFEALKSESPIVGFRGYSAPNMEVLGQYTDQLRSGKWYIDCSVGSSVYGQGMYVQGVFGDVKNNDQMVYFSRVLADGYAKRAGVYVAHSDQVVGRVESVLMDKSSKRAYLFEHPPVAGVKEDLDSALMKEFKNQSKFADVGSFLASKGYDYYTVYGESKTSQEMVVLNRTKVILLGRGSNV